MSNQQKQSAKSVSKGVPQQPVDRPLLLVREPGEDGETALARTALRPTINAAATVKKIDKTFGELDLTSLVNAFAAQVKSIHSGDLKRAEELLISQAQTLDTIFHQLVRRSVGNMGQGHYLQVADTYMRLALRAQGQCRATLETLAVVKNPPAVAFVRQANIANGPQQINNTGGKSQQPDTSRARETENQPNKLLEDHNGERLDIGTEGQAVGSDPAVATVGTFDGTANR